MVAFAGSDRVSGYTTGSLNTIDGSATGRRGAI
jgi:hypothetical protein